MVTHGTTVWGATRAPFSAPRPSPPEHGEVGLDRRSADRLAAQLLRFPLGFLLRRQLGRRQRRWWGAQPAGYQGCEHGAEGSGDQVEQLRAVGDQVFVRHVARCFSATFIRGDVATSSPTACDLSAHAARNTRGTGQATGCRPPQDCQGAVVTCHLPTQSSVRFSKR